MSLSTDEADFFKARERIFKPMGDASTRKDEELLDTDLLASPARFHPYPFPRLQRHMLEGLLIGD